MATGLTLPSSLRSSRWFLIILPIMTLLRPVNMRECALKLPGTNRIDGRPLCITHEDVNQAFSDARQKVGLRTLALREVSDIMLDQLGTTLQETTRILATRFRLSGDELWEAVPEADVSRTEAAKRCPLWLRSAGGSGGGGGGGGGSAACSGATRFRRHDGLCNNLRHSTWGAARTPFKRLLPPEYADGISAPRLGVDRFPLPPARAVSSRVHRDFSREHEHNVTMMFVAWGQLIDHDLTLTAEAKEPVTRRDPDCCGQGPKHPNCLPANVPHDDPFYRKYNQRCISVLRSLAGARSDCRLGPRVQINSITSYIDANFVYGSSFRKADSLRLLRGGLMRTSAPFHGQGLKPLLPPKTEQPDDGCIRHKPGVFCFYAGDNRVNEQLALGVLHTVFVRVHNQIATELSKINQHWDDETLYQETRHIVAAIVQHITYGEFLPLLLGEETMRQYGLNLKQEGYSNTYDPEVDASVPSSFATAAFRFGHSLLPSAMEKRSASHHIIGEKKLSEMLQQPYDLYRPGLVDQYLIGMVDQLAQAMDDSITEEVTNHLFQEPEKHFGKDLATINILRAREHGVPGFIKYKRLCGSDDIDDWSEMVYHFRNSTIDHYLDLYSNIEDIDLWSAGVAEVPKRGSLVGPTFNCIIAGTFRDVKRGDRFWYENDGWPSSFTPEQLSEIRKIKLSRLLCDAGDNIPTLQLRAMQINDYGLNPRVSCSSGLLPTLDLTHWKDYTSNKGPDEYYGENSVSLKPVETFFEDSNYFPSSSLSNSNSGNRFEELDSDPLTQEGTAWNGSSSYSTFPGSPFPYRNPALQVQEISHKKEPYKSWG